MDSGLQLTEASDVLRLRGGADEDEEDELTRLKKFYEDQAFKIRDGITVLDRELEKLEAKQRDANSSLDGDQKAKDVDNSLLLTTRKGLEYMQKALEEVHLVES